MSYRLLADKIISKYDEITEVFDGFQKKSKLLCPPGCGKCCFSTDISCTPFELLPLALYLLDAKLAINFLDKVKKSDKVHCPLLNITDENKGMGNCLYYQYRPYICRAFGVSARAGKNSRMDLSICSVLQQDKNYLSLSSNVDSEIPFIDTWKRNLESLDPKLQVNELPINEALILILEKVLLWDSYSEK